MITAERMLDAAIALDRGDDSLARNAMSDLAKSDPVILSLYWRATGQVDSTVTELRARLAEPPSLVTLLELHRLILAAS